MQIQRNTVIKICLTLLLIACAALGFIWFVWREFYSAEQFSRAIERGNYKKADQLWRFGVRSRGNDPYVGFRQIIDEILATKSVKVSLISYTVRKISSINGIERYFGNVSLRQESGSNVIKFSISAHWSMNKWELVDFQAVPNYVNEIFKSSSSQ